MTSPACSAPGSSPNRPIIARWMEQLLQSTLSFWPTESREWGLALAAEAAQIDHPSDALRWALGGLAFFLRSLGVHFLAWTRLPVGASSSSLPGGGEPPLLPKHSRLTTALLFVAVVVLLLLPWGREAIAGVGDLWITLADSGSIGRQVDGLALRAEQEKDAQTLAFAAITHPDASRGAQLAVKAVALDQSLTWIYTTDFGRGALLRPAGWLDALQSYDPKNGFPLLLAAEDRVRPQFLALVNSHTPREEEIDQLLAGDTQWQELMGRAAAAPEYDDYASRRRALARQTWSRYPSLCPALAIYSQWTTPIPNLDFLRRYVNVQLQNAAQWEVRGEWRAAEQSLIHLRIFGEHMASTNVAPVEQLGGIEVLRRSLLALRSFYAARHRAGNLRAVDQALEEMQHRRNSLTYWDGGAWFAAVGQFKCPAIAVQLSALLFLLGLFAAGISLIFLEASSLLPRLRSTGSKAIARLVCISADYAPLLSLFAALGLLLSFRPFAAAAAQFRSGIGSYADDRYFAGVYFQLQSTALGQPFLFLTDNVWWFVTIALAAAAVFITVRGLTRRPA